MALCWPPGARRAVFLAGWVTHRGRYECRGRHDAAGVAAALRAWAVERGVDLSQWPEPWRLFLA